LDRFESFAPKIEVVEDAEDIRNRGIFKTTIDALGVTSKAMARRIGQHLIFKTIKENQRVAFNTGFEALLCQPGDLIIVEDDLKSNRSNFGKVLDVDVDNEYVRLSGPFDASTMDATLTVYLPTGDQTKNELSDTASISRERAYETFSITSDHSIANLNTYVSDYNFSGYVSGASEPYWEDGYNEQYPVYTGDLNQKIFFAPPPSGVWIFTTGDFYTGVPVGYDFRSETFANDGPRTLQEVNIQGELFDISAGLQEFDSNALFDNLTSTNGILPEEIAVGSNTQIQSISFGNVGTVSGYRGSYVSGAASPELLPYIKQGSPYRLDLKDSSDFVYKIESIKEEGVNEYMVAASKFETGKYDLLESDITIEKKENTYAYEVTAQVGDVTYESLSPPANLTLSTGVGTDPDTFYIRGVWDTVTNNAGYHAILRSPNGTYTEIDIPSGDVFTVIDNIDTIGKFSLSVKTKGNLTTLSKYFDSTYTSASSFFLYEDLADFDKPFFSNISFF